MEVTNKTKLGEKKYVATGVQSQTTPTSVIDHTYSMYVISFSLGGDYNANLTAKRFTS